MASNRPRVLVVGGDAAVWVGLSAALHDGVAQIFAPQDTDLLELLETSEFDALVVVASDGDGLKSQLEIAHAAGIERRTLVLGPDDPMCISMALSMGLGGYVMVGATPAHLASAVSLVLEGGLHYDKGAAAALQDRINFSAPEKSSGMAAARALVSALELKDTYTGGHAERVTALGLLLAEAAHVPEAPVGESLQAAFLLHDVGKIGIPESILTKPSSLTDIERKVLQTHPILGERIVAPLDFPGCVREVVRHHHERWDGSGYPDGLSGYAIPITARIFAIADVLDAMTSVRPYRNPVPFPEAMDVIQRGAGTHFDPALAQLASDIFSDAPVSPVGDGIVLG